MARYSKKTYGRKVNFLASEVGLRLITTQVDGTGITANADGLKIYPAGTIIDGKGVVFEDVDVTNGEHEASLIVAGYILNDKLPTAATSTQITAFGKQGLYFETSDAVERPAD